MQIEALFGTGQARVMMAVAGAMFAALAIRLAWRVVAGEARRHGVAKTAFLLLMSAPLAFWAGGKGGGRPPGAAPAATPAPVVPRREAAPGLRRYFAPGSFAADMGIFTRPTNAVTPSLWMRHSVCNDFREALPDYVAGVCGVVTTQPWGVDAPQRIRDCYETYAPFYATNSLVRGVGEFWAVTNENSKTFVWKNLEHGSGPSNLVSFAATVYDWGDFEFTYGNIPDGGFSAFAKLGAETLDMTQYAASGRTVRVAKNLEQDAEWWLENYPEICRTNAAGELVFEYDTNEWCFVEFAFQSDAYVRAQNEYKRRFDALSNDLVRVEKYSVMVAPTADPDDEFAPSEMDRLFDDFIEAQLQTHGGRIGLEGNNIDSLPGGLRTNDVTYLGCESGLCTNVFTNIFHWVITDYSRVIDKIGERPSGEGLGLTDRGFLPRSRVFSANGLVLDVRVEFYVPTNSVVRFTENKGKTLYTWAHLGDTAGSCIIPCRSGLVYQVDASRGLTNGNDQAVFPHSESILDWGYHNQRRHVYFHRKLSMDIEGVAFTNASFATGHAVMAPPVGNGSYSWEASDNIRVEPIHDGRHAGLFLGNGGGGFVKCVWDNGEHGMWRLCTTGRVDVASCGEAAYTNLAKFVDLRASPHLAVYEDAHLGTNGQPVAAASPTSSLVCSYGGNGAGSLELSQTSGSAVALSDGNAAIALPHTWPVAGRGMEPDRVFNVSGLHVGEVATFRLKFSNDYVPQGIDCQTSIRTVTLVVQADRTWPAERHRHVFGPREVVNLAVPDYSGPVSWDFGNGPIHLNPFSMLLSRIPGPLSVTLNVDGSSYTFPIAVIGPSGVVGTHAAAMTDADWTATGHTPLLIGEVGAGERIDIKLEPDYVSFVGLKTMEGFSRVYNKTGYFAQYNMSNVTHDTANGAGVETTVGEKNIIGLDRAGFAHTLAEVPPPWSDGGFEFRIPFHWRVDGSAQTNLLATHTQRFTLFPNGDAETSKFGWTVHRGTNGVSSVTGPDTSPGQN